MNCVKPEEVKMEITKLTKRIIISIMGIVAGIVAIGMGIG